MYIMYYWSRVMIPLLLLDLRVCRQANCLDTRLCVCWGGGDVRGRGGVSGGGLILGRVFGSISTAGNPLRTGDP